MRLRLTLLMIVFWVLLTAVAKVHAQTDFSKVEIQAQQLAPNVHVLYGAGGNIALLTGDDGAVLIDDQFEPLAPKIRAAIALITDKPVRFVINTHWHYDHTGGNAPFGRSGSVIIAHRNTLQRLSTRQFIELFKTEVPPSPKEALPLVTFEQGVELHLNGEDLEAVHVEHAHTDTDVLLYLPHADIVHTGDTYMNALYPFVDNSSGGSIDGFVAACDSVLARSRDSTRIIPGHGKVATRAEYAAWCSMVRTIRDRVAESLRKRRSLQQTLAAKPTAEFDAQYGGGFIKPDMFVTRIYADLAAKRQKRPAGSREAAGAK